MCTKSETHGYVFISALKISLSYKDLPFKSFTRKKEPVRGRILVKTSLKSRRRRV